MTRRLRPKHKLCYDRFLFISGYFQRYYFLLKQAYFRISLATAKLLSVWALLDLTRNIQVYLKILSILFLLLLSLFNLNISIPLHSPRVDPAMLCYALRNVILWFCVHKQSSVDSAVSQLNSVVIDSLNQAIPYKFPYWFSNILKHYINKKSHLFRRYNKQIWYTLYFLVIFS